MYRSLFENDTIVMLVVDPHQDVIVDANPAAVRFYGRTRDQLCAMRPAELQVCAACDVHRRADGSVATVEVHRAPVDHDGRPRELWVVHDVTEREASQRTLESEALTRRIMVEQSRDGIVVLDDHGGVYEANRVFAEMIGYSLDEVRGLHVWDWDRSVDRAGLEEMIATVDVSGDHFETRHTRKDGTVFDVEISTNAVVVDGQKRIFCICRDISERTAAQAEIAHRHDLMRHIIEHNRSAVAVHDRDLRYIYVSQSYLEQYRVTESDVIGRHHYEVFPDLPEKWREVHRRALAGEVLGAEDDPYEREDGTVDWTTWECRPWYESDGSVGGIVIYTEVVNERKKAEMRLRESEARLRTLSDNIPDGFIYQLEVSPDGSERRFTYVGAGIEKLRGLTQAEVMADASALYNQTHEEDRGMVARLEDEALAHLTRFRAEIRYRAADGTIRWSRLSSEPRRLGDGRIVWDGVEVDITERKNAELELARHRTELESLVSERTRELEETNLELAEASRAKSAFLANMSHELRTPLNSIIGFSGVLLQDLAGPLDERQRAQVEMINRSGRHLLSLINDVLDLAKVESGSVEVRAEAFDVADLVKGVAESIAPLVAEKGLDLEVRVPECPISLVSDEGKVRQVLINLAGNAVKFTDRGTVSITLRPGQDGGAVLTVSDTGCGIPADALATIFDPFAQVEDDRLRIKPAGTGLGLAISQEYAHMLGGEVSVHSEVGKGSTFTLVVPDLAE
ncbi:MAG: PAS domain S-box protein [Aeromicrobium sp.]|nr:PAS domain S-box protein [Aeromicrobium sp.]